MAAELRVRRNLGPPAFFSAHALAISSLGARPPLFFDRAQLGSAVFCEGAQHKGFALILNRFDVSHLAGTEGSAMD
jgi:hypothetical protein